MYYCVFEINESKLDLCLYKIVLILEVKVNFMIVNISCMNWIVGLYRLFCWGLGNEFGVFLWVYLIMIFLYINIFVFLSFDIVVDLRLFYVLV